MNLKSLKSSIAISMLLVLASAECLATDSPPLGQREATTSPTPTMAIQELSLSEAISHALEQRPLLKAYYWEKRRSEAQIQQAGKWQNPQLEVEVENVGGSGRMSRFKAAETTALLSQEFSIGGDISRRREVMSRFADQADWEYEAARVQVIVEIAHGYIAALAADRLLELAQHELELARETARVVHQRVAAGEASPIEQAWAVTPLLDAELNLSRAERAREAARLRLALAMGESTLDFENLSGNLEEAVAPPKRTELALELGKNPEVARWASEIALRQAERRLAVAEAIPNITASGGIRHWNDTDETAFVVGATMPLPIFDRKQGTLLAARRAERAAWHQQEEAMLRVESLLSEQYERLVNAYEEASVLVKRGIPAMEAAYEGARASFTEGDASLVEVITAQRGYFDLQQRYVRALVSYHTALAEVEALVGIPIRNEQVMEKQ